MARIKQDMMALLSGSIGNVVVVRRFGTTYLRSKPVIKKRKPTAGQLLHRQKFSAVSKLLQLFKPVTEISFPEHNDGKSGYSYSVGLNFKRIISGDNDPFTFDYSQLILSEGKLPAPQDVQVSRKEQDLRFTWRPVEHSARPVMILIAYCIANNQVVYSAGKSLLREGIGILSIPKEMNGQIHCWAACITENGKFASDSVYAGSVNL